MGIQSCSEEKGRSQCWKTSQKATCVSAEMQETSRRPLNKHDTLLGGEAAAGVQLRAWLGVWTHGESCWHSLQHAQREALPDPELPKQDLSPLRSPIMQLSHTHFPQLPQTNPCCAKQPRCKFLDGLLRLDPSSLNLLTSPP